MPVIALQNVSKSYKIHAPWYRGAKPQVVHALQFANLTVEPGEVCALLGPNGAGKTTLLKIVANLIIPDFGEVNLFGRPLSQLKSSERAWMSWMAGEEKSFYWRLTGRQNLEFFATLYDIPARSARSKIENLAARLELDGLDKMYQEYSTGHRQRLAMIRALMIDAKLILMDEPTRSLDPAAALHFQSLIREQMVSSKRTVLMATHNLKEAESLADHVVILFRGRIKTAGKVSEIKTQGWPSLEAYYYHHMRL